MIDTLDMCAYCKRGEHDTCLRASYTAGIGPCTDRQRCQQLGEARATEAIAAWLDSIGYTRLAWMTRSGNWRGE